MEQERTRAANFTADEAFFLVELAEARANIIENKRTDAMTWSGKSNAWEEISKDFANKFGIKRGAKHLRLKYDKLKRKTKRTLASEKGELYLTGGGKVAKQLTDVTMNRLAFDSEYSLISKSPSVVDVPTAICVPKDVLKAESANEEQNTINPWSSWNPSQLKSKKSVKLTQRKKRSQNQNADLMEAQQQYFLNEDRRFEERHQWEKEQAAIKTEFLRYELETKKV